MNIKALYPSICKDVINVRERENIDVIKMFREIIYIYV